MVAEAHVNLCIFAISTDPHVTVQTLSRIQKNVSRTTHLNVSCDPFGISSFDCHTLP